VNQIEKCDAYHTRKKIQYVKFCPVIDHVPEEVEVSECWGTKEREECNCGGDPSKCTFYPEKRAEAENENRTVEEFLNTIQPPEPETIYSKNIGLHKYPSVKEMSKLGFYRSHREFRDCDMWSCFFSEIDYLHSKIDRLNEEIALLKSKN